MARRAFNDGEGACTAIFSRNLALSISEKSAWCAAVRVAA
jgi:hypothetical protein